MFHINQTTLYLVLTKFRWTSLISLANLHKFSCRWPFFLLFDTSLFDSSLHFLLLMHLHSTYSSTLWWYHLLQNIFVNYWVNSSSWLNDVVFRTLFSLNAFLYILAKSLHLLWTSFLMWLLFFVYLNTKKTMLSYVRWSKKGQKIYYDLTQIVCVLQLKLFLHTIVYYNICIVTTKFTNF